MSQSSYVTREELARRLNLLQRELMAETHRVQILERNLDTLLQRNTEIEARLSRTRAMLMIAFGDEAVDVDGLKAELTGGQLDGAAIILSHALLTALHGAPTREVAQG